MMFSYYKVPTLSTLCQGQNKQSKSQPQDPTSLHSAGHRLFNPHIVHNGPTERAHIVGPRVVVNAIECNSRALCLGCEVDIRGLERGVGIGSVMDVLGLRHFPVSHRVDLELGISAGPSENLSSALKPPDGAVSKSPLSSGPARLNNIMEGKIAKPCDIRHGVTSKPVHQMRLMQVFWSP
nr:hypothetical protein Iba_chr06bCG16800 [Ipomoea batatas]